jgi:ankyrin repeat protein
MRLKPVAGCSIVVLLSLAHVNAANRAPSLVEAVKNGDLATVRALVKQPNAVNAQEADGTTPLHWATDRDDMQAAAVLIRAGANVKAVNRYGVTPLYEAAVYGNAAMIEQLLKAGADPNAALPEGETTLMTAARTGKPDAVKVLLAHGADVNAREAWKQQTALMWAAHEGNTEVVHMLLAAGANIHERSRFGFTPLLFAARQGQIGAIKALLAAGARVNETLPDGTSAVVSAIQGLNYEAASVLLDNGADPNAAGQGWTALHQVVWSRRPQRGQNNPGQKPQGNVNSLELARRLVAHGADVNARETREPDMDQEGRNSLNRYGATPFLLAAKACDIPMMQTLQVLGSDPFLTNEDGTTPLMVAAGVGIFSQGENPGTPEESAEAVKILLDLGAEPNAVDKNGDTAMHGPSYRGSNDAVMLLVKAGANLDVRNKRGWRPLTIAEGVFLNARVQMNLHTAKLLRELMTARGMDVTEKDLNFNGAMRADRVVESDQLDAQTPADIQRKLLEEQTAKKPPR